VVVVDIWRQINWDHCGGTRSTDHGSITKRDFDELASIRPSRSGWTITVTGIPGLSAFGSNPAHHSTRSSELDGPLFRTPKFLNRQHDSGVWIVHWRSFTVPRTKTSLWASNAAKEWCAAAELTCKSTRLRARCRVL
jgi:hypothetical protein